MSSYWLLSDVLSRNQFSRVAIPLAAKFFGYLNFLSCFAEVLSVLTVRFYHQRYRLKCIIVTTASASPQSCSSSILDWKGNVWIHSITVLSIYGAPVPQLNHHLQVPFPQYCWQLSSVAQTVWARPSPHPKLSLSRGPHGSTRPQP